MTFELANGWRTLASGRRVYFEGGKIVHPVQQTFPEAPTFNPDEEPELSDREIVIQSYLCHPHWTVEEIVSYMVNDEFRPVMPGQVVTWLLDYFGGPAERDSEDAT